jgi:hypothetical protein
MTRCSTGLYNLLILVEYRAILRRHKVPAHALDRLINRLRRVGAEVEVRNLGGFSRDPQTGPVYHL